VEGRGTHDIALDRRDRVLETGWAGGGRERRGGPRSEVRVGEAGERR